MSGSRLHWPVTTTASFLAALTTWVSLWAWAGFVERPSGFLVPCLGACLLVAVVGLGLRWGRVPTLLVPLGQLAVLLLWLNHTWAGDLARAGWVPTTASLQEIAARLSEGVTAANSFAAPVPESVPQIHAVLIVAGAITAVLVDLLACGFRQVPIAGLPLLAVYTAPVSILDGGVSWWGFAVAAVCFLLLLANDEAHRLAHWGRQIGGSQRLRDSARTDVTTAALRSSARKIGLTATGLAVVLPVFIPTLSADLFDGPGPGGDGDGDAVSITNPVVDLKRNLSRGSDVDMVWVTTPDPSPSYLRIAVLDFFDGTTWKPSKRQIPVEQRAEGRLPRPPGLEPDVERSQVPYQFDIGSQFASRWLPTPYPVYSIDAPGDWRYDTTTMDFISAADGQSTENLSYRLEALKLAPTARQLQEAGPTGEEIFTPYTALPRSFPDSVRTLARDVTDQQVDKFAKAVRLQEWFRRDGGFTYSLQRSPGNGVEALTTFLGTGPKSRVGYCEQFAAAMAVMSRALNIPARVSVGFMRPQRIGDDRWVYSAHDLHAWPELYFEGTGWVRFEPTPAVQAPTVPGYTRGGAADALPDPVASSVNANQGQNRIDRAQDQQPATADPAADTGRGAGGGALLFGLLVALAVAVLAGMPRAARGWTRRRRWAQAGTWPQAAEAGWSELRDSTVDLGLPWDDSVTLRTRARSLAACFAEPGAEVDEWTGRRPSGPEANPAAAEALQRLVQLVEQARFARHRAATDDAAQGDDPVGRVRADVDLCVDALHAGVAGRRRLRARWLPGSLVHRSGGRTARRRAVDARPLTEQGIDRAV
ncbi:MAG TPA: DUF3488 and transglutaminase-like domain-containing protein [Nocardioidaceae bacterium]|nr:DUF3488 and transglutaminase-like domain-containing protein [Nocardioidaceae bacterium]